MDERKTITRTLAETKSLMRKIARKEGIRLDFHDADQGGGGYNYGWSGDGIFLPPFVKGKKGEKVGKYELHRDCDNPIECMLITFFHELAHLKLSDKVPSQIKGYAWNDTSRFQYELWISMLGVEYAHSKYGIKFSDQSVKWLVEENASYMRDASAAKESGYGLICTKATLRSYTVVSQWEFRGEKEKKDGNGGRKRGAKKGGKA